jgi:hypothetical protein
VKLAGRRLFVLASWLAIAAPGAMAAAVPDVAAWQRVLEQYVSGEGLVDYAAIHDDLAPLDGYVAQLAAVSPQSHPQLFPSRESKLAYWMNAYNALVVWAFAKEYPKGAARLATKFGQGQFFYLRKFPVGGQQRSLDDIEANSIRKGFSDPRIHFAINCASASCPPLSRTAFTAANVDAELDRLTRAFVNSPRHVELKPTTKPPSVRLSMVFKWYESDFGGRAKLRTFLATYRPADAAAWTDPALRFTYIPYDWSLNGKR